MKKGINTFWYIDVKCHIQNDTSITSSSPSEDVNDDAKPILFAGPQVVDSSHIIIYPLIFERTSSRSSFSSGSDSKITFWNLVFYNSDNNTQHLLTYNKKVIINSIHFCGSSSSSSNDDCIAQKGFNLYKNNILYDVTSTDFNHNDNLDDDDPNYLYVSDKQGNNFRQISPDNYNITSWEVLTGTSKIILQGQKDSNGDRKFDNNDQVTPMLVDITSGKVATEIFSRKYMDSLKRELLIASKRIQK